MSMESKRAEHGRSPAPSENYEKRDANISSILKFGAGLFVILFVVFVAMRWTFAMMGKMEPMGDAATPFESARVLPPAPRLQVDPGTGLHNYCAGQMQALTTYAWKDSRAGIVQIPVDRAIEVMAERGVPARAAEKQPAGAEVQAPPAPLASDVTGPCGYVTEHDADPISAEGSAAGEKQ